MKKVKVFVWFFIILLFFACSYKNSSKSQNKYTYKKTCLFIQNHSSVPIKDVKFNGKTFEGKDALETVLVTGEKKEINLKEDSSGYVYFSIIDVKNNKEIQVRSDEVIFVGKKQEFTFAITDNTLVLPINSTVKFTVLGIVAPTRLKVFNYTTVSIEKINYSVRSKQEKLLTNEMWQADFSSDVSGKLQFKLLNPKNKQIFDVELEEEIAIKIGEIKEIKLTNNSFVICNEKRKSIASLLGISTVSIVNNSKLEIINLALAGQKRQSSLKKGESWSVGFYQNIDALLNFQVQTEYKTFNLQFVESIHCEVGEFKSLIINDESLVKISDYNKPIRLADILEASFLTISNKSSVELIDVVYADVVFGNVSQDGVKSQLVWNANNIARPISFKVCRKDNDSIITLTTVKEFLL